jgi:choline-sulfatase
MGRYRIREIRCRHISWLLLISVLTISASCKSSGPSGTTGPDPTDSLRPLNLVVVTIDTLRADRLHCYGNSGIETPTLDGLAQRGARFENAVAQAPLTPPSHASIFTGTNPNVHQVRNTGGFALKSPSVTLAKILKQHGWETAAFVGASVLKKTFGFSQGFDVYDDQMPKPENSRDDREYPERRASVVVDHALSWLNSQSGKPYFVWIHLYDPHEPYDPPEPFREKYQKNLYDGEVAYADGQLGRFLDAVAKKSHSQKTLIVVLADHGESLGEHGEFNHGVFLYDSTLRIPLLMAGPGVPAVKVTQQARTIDVLPTILDLMGGRPPAACQGTSLTPAFTNRGVPTTYSYEETLYPKMNMGWAELRGVRTNRWKYVLAPKPELYDLLNDPGERSNVADAHPAELRELQSQLKALSRVSGDGKVSSSAVDSHTLDQLKSLGYLSGISSGEFQLNGKGADPKDRTKTLLAFQTALGPGSHTISPARRIEVLRQALAEDSQNPSLYFYLAAEYEKNGRYAQALSVCESAQTQGVWSGRLLSRTGDLYLRDGKKDQAIAAYEKAAQYNPSDIESQTNLATAYLEEGKLADAERCFRWALAIEEYAPAYNGLGLIAIQRQQPAAAQKNFESAVALDPKLVEAQLNLGLVYKMAGDIPRAKTCFEAFLAGASRARYRKIIPQVQQELEKMP